ncbi:MAG: ABC transporter permease [Hyphomicrobiales bacterium]|nr:ABC transporter permease [Hyphomicrobiales bacterium]
MLNYVIRRLLTVPLSLVIVLGVIFAVLRLTGDPVEIYLGITRTPEQVDLLRLQLHLDSPVLVQFGYYLLDVLKGDFGRSLQFSAPAMTIVLHRLAMTGELMVTALAVSLVLGILGGILAAVYKDRTADFIISGLAVAGQSMPSFWLGILLVQIFALNLHWLPTSGTGDLRHLILPSITLAAFVVPNFILITRTSVLETMQELYVVAARAKGLSRSRVLFRHILPNALNPIVSFLGLQVGRLVGGSIITETIFAWPGVGRLLIGSIFQRDVPVVIAGVFMISIVVIAVNLLVEITLAFTDPRIRLD